MASITKRHIQIGSKKIFVQILGKGPAIVLLHPSPHSSDMLLPLANRLAQKYTVFCVDTPGYGRSDGFEAAPKDIIPYVDILHELIQKMGINKCALYGTATGCQIAIRYGLRYQETVSHLFLDNSAHFDDNLRTKILQSYFPDLTPRQDGSHLDRLWDIVTHLFKYFPWCFKHPEYAIQVPEPPANILHAIAMDYLKVGKNYDHAYRVAFIHEDVQNVQQLQVNATLFRWKGSIVLPYMDMLLSYPLPDNVTSINIDKDPSSRLDGMVAHILEKSSKTPNYEMPDDVGQPYVEDTPQVSTVSLPEITTDGSYLKEAWNLILEQNGNVTVETIQKILVNGYTTQKN